MLSRATWRNAQILLPRGSIDSDEFLYRTGRKHMRDRCQECGASWTVKYGGIMGGLDFKPGEKKATV